MRLDDLAAIGLAGLVILTNIGVHPRSMVGTDAERISNMNPPTACIVALTLWLVGLAMLARPALSCLLARPRPWKAVVAANGVIMTVFLWHLTALLIAIIALRPLGFGLEGDSTARWWIERPLWIAAPAAILSVLVAIFARFERPRASAGGRVVQPAGPE